MRSYRVMQRAAVLVAAVTAALVGVAAPASADVTVSPSTAPQGSGQNLEFGVPNDKPGVALTQVVLTLPVDQPIAEVYPLSVDNWAPRLTTRELNPPLPGIHGSMISQATESVTWTAMPGLALAPGATAKLRVAVGPLPTGAQTVFALQGTWADGSTGPISGAVAQDGRSSIVRLGLTAADGSGAPPTAGHGGHGDTGQTAPQPAAASPATPPADDGANGWGVLGWVAAALCSLIGLGATLRAKRAAARPKDFTAAPATKKTSGTAPTSADARVKVSAWSYRDGP